MRKFIYSLRARIFNVNTSQYWEEIWKNDIKNTPEFRFYPNKYNALVSLIPEKSSVLDVGCGMGILMEKIACEKDCKVIGVDISKTAVDFLKERGLDAKVAKVPPIPFEDKKFDVVIATEFLEHFVEPLLIFDEILRVLKDKGMFILSVPEGHGPDTNIEHLKTYNYSSLKKLIQKRTDKIRILRINEEKGWRIHLVAYGFKKEKLKHYLFLRRFFTKDGYGGCEKHLLDYFKRIDYDKSSVTLVVSAGKKNIFENRIMQNNLPVKIVEFPFEFKNPFFTRFLNMFFFLKRLKVDIIVYVQGGFGNFNFFDVLAGYCCTKRNIFITEHFFAPVPAIRKRTLYFGVIPGFGLWWHTQMLFYKLTAYLPKRILAVSEGVKERLITYYGYPKGKIISRYHGVETKKFSPDSDTRNIMRKGFKIPENDTIIISTARLSKEKKINSLINAFDLVFKNNNKSWLFILGDGAIKKDLEELAIQKLSKERIKFLGFQEDVSDYLKMSDIFVLCSETEGLGIALLEAMSTGLISIATKTAGPKEIIKNGINGFLIDMNEKEIQLGICNALALSLEKRNYISKNAREFILERFDIEKSVNDQLDILDIYERR